MIDIHKKNWWGEPEYDEAAIARLVTSAAEVQWSEKLIQDAISADVMDKGLAVPNFTVRGFGEADLLCLRESGTREVVEVKISKADFRREFKKGVQQRLEQAHKGKNTAPRYYEFPNKYSFAMPLPLALELAEEIPVYAGLYGVAPVGRDDVCRGFIVKRPPNIRAGTKTNTKELIRVGRGIALRYWDLRARVADTGRMAKATAHCDAHLGSEAGRE